MALIAAVGARKLFHTWKEIEAMMREVGLRPGNSAYKRAESSSYADRPPLRKFF
ncbi:hypothetical protein TUZN_0916 [Thermoproteus uzoniensis 768-20]|uniref:Uncharacterized protein n=1 Tax=Thermoproteus uzoniensis (strain 768-20) TaxID=999630 RepID=F2L5V5_THEU7|nr:hypothetical protein [Thermoproteus uzoniensis]AEA12400.1 hypothetical protein TUZN_0916 [Thermoproteus uzoniensis 768-20]